MQFRDYRPADYLELLSLWKELDLSGTRRGDTQEIIEQTINMGGKLLLMIDPVEKIIIGSSWMTCDGRRLFLHHFGIMKRYQKRGLGTLLTKESLKFIKEKGCQVKLEVHKDNISAKRLYEKEGFILFTDYDIFMIQDLNKI